MEKLIEIRDKEITRACQRFEKAKEKLEKRLSSLESKLIIKDCKGDYTCRLASKRFDYGMDSAEIVAKEFLNRLRLKYVIENVQMVKQESVREDLDESIRPSYSLKVSYSVLGKITEGVAVMFTE